MSPQSLSRLSRLSRTSRPGGLGGRRVARALLATLAAVLPAVLAVGTPRALSAQQLDVTLEPETLTVGDHVSATLTVTAPRGAVAGDPRFPEWGDSWGEAEVLEAGPVERVEHLPGEPPRSQDTAAWRQRLVLTSFRTGTIPLPPRAVTLPFDPDRSAGRREGTVELRTPPGLALTVGSVLPPGTDPSEAEPAPAAPPRPLPAGSRFWWALATAALLAIATVAVAVVRRPRTTPRLPRRATPLEELLESLRVLSADASTAAGADRGHEGLSFTLRRYLGRSLEFAAVESTTTEVKHHLRHQGMPPELVTRADDVLQACDRVKFACEPASRTALAERLDAVREIARELDCRLHRPVDPWAVGPDRGDRERP